MRAFINACLKTAGFLGAVATACAAEPEAVSPKEASGAAEAFKSYVNPIAGRTLSVEERWSFGDEVVAVIRQSNPDYGKTPSVARYLVRYDGGNAHVRQLFSQRNDFNVRDTYLVDGVVYNFDSNAPETMSVRNLDAEDLFAVSRLKKMFFNIFFMPESFGKTIKGAKIAQTDKAYAATWSADGKREALWLDLEQKRPIFYEKRAADGEVIERSNVRYEGNGFVLDNTVYNSGGRLFLKTQLTVSFEAKEALAEVSGEPEGFGHRFVSDDRRGGPQRKYHAIDKLPKLEFLDALFSDKEKVLRYNAEIERRAAELEKAQ